MAWRIIEDEASAAPIPQESTAGMLGRNAVSGAASAASGFAGVPGSIEGLIESFVMPRRQEGADQSRYIHQQDPEVAEILRTSHQEYGPGGRPTPSLESVLPGPEKIKQGIGKLLPEGYLEPRNEGEKVYQNIAEDFGSLLFPFGGVSKAPVKTALGKAATISGAGNIAKWGAQRIGLGESEQNKVKVATMLATSFGMMPSMSSKATERYNKLRDTLSPTKTISSKPISNLIHKLQSEVTNTGNIDLPSKKAFSEMALKSLSEIAKPERANLKELLNYQKGFGELYKNLRQYPEVSPAFKELKNGVNAILKNNPEVPKEISTLLSEADDIYRGTALTQKALKFIKNTSNVERILGGGTTGLGGLLAYTLYPEKTMQVAGNALTIGAGVIGANSIKNFIFNPTIRNEYVKMLVAAGKENAPAVVNHAKSLAQAIKVEDKKENKELSSGKWRIIED